MSVTTTLGQKRHLLPKSDDRCWIGLNQCMLLCFNDRFLDHSCLVLHVYAIKIKKPFFLTRKLNEDEIRREIFQFGATSFPGSFLWLGGGAGQGKDPGNEVECSGTRVER